MALAIVRLGVPRAGGGCLFVAVGDPGVAIEWSLVGPGVLHPLSTVTNKGGVASARWAAGEGTPAIAGDQITVTAEAYP